MRNSYTMQYGYQSLIYPARMFKTREDAAAFDAAESTGILLGAFLTRPRLEAIASGTVAEGDKDNCSAILAALRWTVNAADGAEDEKRSAKWRQQRESDAAKIAAE